MGSTEHTMWTLPLTALLASCLTCLAAELTPGASLYGQRQQYAQAYPYTAQDEDKTSLSNMMYALSPVLLPPPNTAEETDEAAKYYNSYYSNTEENADKYYAAYNTADNAKKYYSPTDMNTEDNADIYYYPYYFSTEENADKYYYPYYFNTEENADLFYKKASPESDPWLAYYDSLPTHVGQYQGPLVDELPKHAGQYQGPQVDVLPQHTGQYQGPDQSGHFEEVDPQENMIFDVPRIFLKGFN